MKIDIVIPIYNAYDYTVKCVESVLKYTEKGIYNLILINDKSTDYRIKDYLDELKTKKLENIYILENEVNLGFVKTVNRGMEFSKNDVVLLNSDTEVTSNWLNKINKAAYLNDKIATVTPLTNNGTICSIPNYCEDNELPNNISLEEYAEIVEKTSLRLYPDIPTAVGFCMYIKRHIIEEIGLFDSESYGKGYGEENDFCCRAIEQGYTHILCDDTFIYHKGTTSFLGEKEEYIKKNSMILNKKYPYYDSMIQKFIKSYTLKPIIDNIKLQISIRNKNKNILYIIHNDFIRGENHPIGGTEYHTKDLIYNIKDANCYVMYTTKNEIHLQRFENNEIITFKFNMRSIIEDITYSSYDYRKSISKIIDYFQIDIIHIQHFKTHSFDIINIAKEKNIPIYLTLHDYYLICPKINLLDVNNKYCSNTRSTQMCRMCIKDSFGYDTDILTTWNKNISNYLKKIDKIFAPSQSVADIFKKYYINLNSELDIEIIQHGMNMNTSCKSIKNTSNDKFKIAFIGGLSRNKGSKMIHDIIVQNNNQDIEWHIFGNIGDQRLNLLKNKSLIKHGRYERSEIRNCLIDNGIDLVCILSLCPETYSYTLSEAIQAKIPVLATEIGALKERISDYRCGWLTPYDSVSKDILELIYYIRSNEEEYNEKLKNIRSVTLDSIETMCSKYSNSYKTCEKRKIISNEFINMEILNIYKTYNIDETNYDSIESSMIIASIKEENYRLKKELENIKNTIGWKLLDVMRTKYPNISIFGKKIIYKFAAYK